MSQYLLQITNNFYYRRRIPKQYSVFFSNKNEFRLSFGKISKIAAIMKVKKINLLFEELLMALELDTFDKKDQLVTQYMDAMKNYYKEAYFAKKHNGQINTHNLEYDRLLCKSSIDSNYSHFDSSIINEVFVQADISPEEIDEETFKQVQSLYLHKRLEMLNELLVTINPNEYTNTIKQTSNEPTTIKLAGITFKELYDLFIKEKLIASPKINPSTLRDYQAAYDDFIYVMPNAESMDISKFQKQHFRVFVNALHNHLPSSRTKKAKYRDLPYSKLKEIKLTDKEKMATETKKKKVSTIKQMFDIAIDQRYDYLEKNLAVPFLIRNKEKGNSSRKQLSDENIQKLITHPKFLKFRDLAPEKYWIPIIDMHSGMRQNEICQLYVEDLKEHHCKDGTIIYYFDLNENTDDKHLKNPNAFRIVPLHPDLIKLGFLDYFNDVKKRHNRLWPNLKYSKGSRTYAKGFSASFGHFFDTYISEDPNQVFHSIRHNVSTQLLKNAVKHRLPKDLMNRILGHEPAKDETTQSYFDGYGVEELYEGIKTLKIIVFDE